MSFPDKFDEIWSGRDQLQIVEPPPESLFCRWAQTLHAYAAELIDPLEQLASPTPERVMQAMLRLQRQYFRLRLQAPARCRKHLVSPTHICLHPVYEDAYRRLEAILDKAEDRSLFSPPKAPPAPKPTTRRKTITELLLGEE